MYHVLNTMETKKPRKKVAKKKASRIYSEEEKKNLVNILAENDYNYLRTSKQTGVAIKTLKRWVEKFSANVSPQCPQVQQAEVSLITAQQQDYIERAMAVREKLLARIDERIPVEKNLFALGSILKIINEMTEPKDQGDGLTQNNMTFAYFQQINNKIVQKNKEYYGTTGDKDKGNQ